MDTLSRIEFSVRYRLGEYLHFVTEHAFDTDDALRTLSGVRRHLARITLQCVATIGFVYKSSRVGRCDFTIDATGVSRRTKGGPGSVGWSRVKAVHTYSRGFLIELESGAMPIPFRVLSPEQQAQFRLLAADQLLAGPQPNNSFKPTPLRGAA
ncbi:YcxB family protein [Luteimonas sp. A537]